MWPRTSSLYTLTYHGTLWDGWGEGGLLGSMGGGPSMGDSFRYRIGWLNDDRLELDQEGLHISTMARPNGRLFSARQEQEAGGPAVSNPK